MTEKEFNLSEKRKSNYETIEYIDGDHTHQDQIEVFSYDEEDVKEFIKRLKKEIKHNKFIEGKQPILIFIDKLAGDKLR